MVRLVCTNTSSAAEGFGVGNNFAVMAVVALAVVMVLGLATGTVLVIRDTVRRRGPWGINLRPVRCPTCSEPASVIRRPKNLRQALWGGCTCEECGTEYDKWGRKIAKRKGRKKKGTA
jgi:hypothetical protein